MDVESANGGVQAKRHGGQAKLSRKTLPEVRGQWQAAIVRAEGCQCAALTASILTLALVASLGSGALRRGRSPRRSRHDDLREWLTYLASDELQGRAVYTEGLGLAAGYIQTHLQDWGLSPRGDNGTIPADRPVGA